MYNRGAVDVAGAIARQLRSQAPKAPQTDVPTALTNSSRRAHGRLGGCSQEWYTTGVARRLQSLARPEGSEVEEGFVGLSRLVVRCSVGNLSRACTNRAIADGRFEHAGLVERVGGDGSS